MVEEISNTLKTYHLYGYMQDLDGESLPCSFSVRTTAYSKQQAIDEFKMDLSDTDVVTKIRCDEVNE